MSVRNTIVVTVRLSMSDKQLFVENTSEIGTSSWRKAFYIEDSVLTHWQRTSDCKFTRIKFYNE